MKRQHTLLATLSIAIYAFSAIAQDDEEDFYDLGSITVTTQKLNRSLFDAQESISLANARVIEERSLFDLEDVFNQTANAYTMSGEGFGIRGISHNSVSTGGGEGELASYYIDGVAFTGFSKRFGPSDLWDVSQIEILRGPQSTNVGRNALAGAVSLRTNDPIMTDESAVRLGASDDGGFRLSGMTNVAFSGQSAFRIAFDRNETDGFVSNPTIDTDTYDARENTTARAKWLWTADNPDDLKILLNVQYGSTDRGENLVLLDDPEARINTSNLVAFETNDSLNASLDLTKRLNGRWNLLSQTSWLDSEYDRFDDDDQGPGGFDAFRGREAEEQNWSQEIRFSYDDGEALKGVAGVFYTNVDLINITTGKVNIQPALVGVPDSLLPFYPELLPITIESRTDRVTENLAFFTEWEKEVGKNWTLWAALRYDEEELDNQATGVTALQADLPDPSNPIFPAPVAAGIAQINGFVLSQLATTDTRNNTKFDAYLPQIGATYKWNDELSTGFLIKRGYRAGGAETPIVGGVNEYDPEYLTNYELSLRSRSMGGKLVTKANVYYGEWEDQQVAVQQSQNSLDVITENAGSSEIYGAEVELIAYLSSRLNLYSTYGYSQTEFTDFVTPQADFTGNRFASSPKQSFSLGGTYKLNDNWSTHANVTHQGDAWGDLQNERHLDARTLVNLRLAYRADKWSAKFFVNNLFDEVYLQSNVSTLSGGAIGVVGDPRLVGAEFTARF